PLPVRAGLNREALRKRLADWQGLLRQAPAIARQLLRKLLPEPIVIEPIPGGVRFRGRAAWAAVLTGVLQSACVVVPPVCLAHQTRHHAKPSAGSVLRQRAR